MSSLDQRLKVSVFETAHAQLRDFYKYLKHHYLHFSDTDAVPESIVDHNVLL